MESTDARPEGSLETRSGVVLAGGYSRRFGNRDKALVPFDGTPMIRHVVERVGSVVGTITVSCRKDQRAALSEALADSHMPVKFVTDPVDDGGPLVGLDAALESVSADVTAVVACDMPAVDPAFIEFLFSRLDECDAVVPTLKDGTAQPTQAVYRTEPLRAACAGALDAGEDALFDVLSRLNVSTLSPETVAARTSWRSLTNVNTPEELAKLERSRSDFD